MQEWSKAMPQSTKYIIFYGFFNLGLFKEVFILELFTVLDYFIVDILTTVFCT